MQITRIALVALLAAAVAAPTAPASVPVDRGTASGAHATSDVSEHSGYAALAAHKEAIATRNWERIAQAPTVSLSPVSGKGSDDPPAVAAIAGLSIVLLTLALLGRSAIGRRRTRTGVIV